MLWPLSPRVPAPHGVVSHESVSLNTDEMSKTRALGLEHGGPRPARGRVWRESSWSQTWAAVAGQRQDAGELGGEGKPCWAGARAGLEPGSDSLPLRLLPQAHQEPRLSSPAHGHVTVTARSVGRRCEPPYREPPSKSRGGGRGRGFPRLGGGLTAQECWQGARGGGSRLLSALESSLQALGTILGPGGAGEGVRAERAHSGGRWPRLRGALISGADGKGFDNIVHDSLFSKIGFLCPSCLWNRWKELQSFDPPRRG